MRGLERALHHQLYLDAQEGGQISLQLDELEQARCFDEVLE